MGRGEQGIVNHLNSRLSVLSVALGCWCLATGHTAELNSRPPQLIFTMKVTLVLLNLNKASNLS